MARRTARALGAATGLAPCAMSPSTRHDELFPLLQSAGATFACPASGKPVEPGPPALLTPRGIFFIYNASNDAARGDARLRAGEYTVGEVLFDRLDPLAVIARSERYFLRAERRNEVSGQMENTAFVEGTSRVDKRIALVRPTLPHQRKGRRYGVASAFSTSAMVIIMVIGSSGDSWNPARW